MHTSKSGGVRAPRCTSQRHVASARPRLLAVLAGLLALAAFLIPPAPTPVLAQSTSDAIAVMEKVLHQGFARRSYELRIQLLRSEPSFLEACFPPYIIDGLQFSYLEGKVTWIDPDRYDIFLSPRGKRDMITHFQSEDGFNLSLVSTDGFTPAPAAPPPDVTAPSPVASASASASPDAIASGSPSPDASPSPSPVLSPTDSGAPDPLRAFRTPYRYHPLTFLWPFQLKKTPTAVTFRVTGEETLVGRPCWKIDRVAPDLTMQLWISKQDYSVVRIEYQDPTSGELVRFNATTFFTVLPEADVPSQVPMYAFGQATLGTQFKPLCDIAALEAPGVVPAPIVTESKAPGSQTTVPISAPNKRESDTPRILTGFGILIVSGLLMGLTWYGGRYLLFLLRRTVLSKELIVLDDGEGTLTRLLQGLGLSTVPASMEILTTERSLLGKKYEPGVLPRAVVIAPHAIGQAKNYLFLLKAYVDEGGRVLLLDHGKADQAVLPFRLYTLPNSGDKIGLQAKPHIWKRLREEDVETKTGHLLPREFVMEVDQRRPDVDLVQAFNRATGVRMTVVGVQRSGKGEYILCQYRLVDDLNKSKIETSPITRLLTLDLIDYLQGRSREQQAQPTHSSAS